MNGEHPNTREAPTTERKLRAFDPTRHSLEGGTFVTNLSENIQLYEQAVKEYGDSRLIIHDKPCGGGACMADAGWKSLHYLGDEPRGGRWNRANWGDGFWRIFHRLEEQHKEWLKLKDFAP